MIGHIPPVAVARAPGLQIAQALGRIVGGAEDLRVSRVVQGDMRDAMGNAQAQIGPARSIGFAPDESTRVSRTTTVRS